jgi:hypothetical protein
MDLFNSDIARTIAIYVSAFAGLANLSVPLIKWFLTRPSFALKIESQRLIEDYPGEIGIQLNISLRGYNGSFFLKSFSIEHSKKVINENSEIELDILEYVEEDLIEKYLNEERQRTTVLKREEYKIDQFSYYIQLRSGAVEMRTDKETGNAIPSYIGSIFQGRIPYLCREQIVSEGRYRKIADNIKSIRDLRVGDDTSLSITCLIYIYGKLDMNNNKREILPLDGWKMIIQHSEGRIHRKLKPKKIPYSQLSKSLATD